MDIAAAAGGGAFGIALIGTSFALGLRHGVDWDHIAAITDITSSQSDRRRSLLYSTLYATGHAVMVLALGLVAILLGDLLSPTVDSIMERVVGGTLVVLGGYVFFSLFRNGRDFRMRSRWMLVFSFARRVVRAARGQRRPQMVEIVHEHEHLHPHDHEHEELPVMARSLPVASARVATQTHSHVHTHVAPMPQDPFLEYGRVSSFVVGLVHGLGAETASQVLLFLAAAGADGQATALAVLVSFLAGLFVTNTLTALASIYGFLHASRAWPVYATVAVVTGTFSLTLGILYLAGRGDVVPGILG